MGNSTSNANSNRSSNVNGRRVDSPSRRSPRPQSPSSPRSSSLAPHRSLRTKKKSLELPDLASLALTPGPYSSTNSSPGQYRRPLRTSSPIPIPTSPANGTGSSRGRPQNVFPSAQQMSDVLVDQTPSTHIPINHPNRSRANPYFRGAPLQYNSTRSFSSRNQAHQPRMQEVLFGRSSHPPPFVQETVHSTIPLALHKAEEARIRTATAGEEGEEEQETIPRKPYEDPKEPVPVKIIWRHGGKSVVLARAGDDNWKGRQAMERENPSSDVVWSTWVSLLPGTHHIKFIVDDQWRVADDLPTAVDDEGSLANYVAVPISGFTPPSGVSTASHTNANSPVVTLRHHTGQSFWSASSSNSGAGPSSFNERNSHLSPGWTSEFPPELLAAAREEESYLTSSSSASDSASTLGIPAPNIPPAPALPRHLDKLILNVRASPPPATNGRGREREKEREDRRSGRKSRSQLRMTSTMEESPTGDIPVTTASGTEVGVSVGPGGNTGASAPTSSRTRLDGLGLADDTSVLPVPSHVVLHHLSTSAIRNGVLAVGNTTRYKKKYITTIFYKPT